MFLSALSEKEKSAFIALANSVINADNSLADVEKILLSQFYQEMSLAAEEVIQYSFDEAVAVFLDTDRTIRKQIFIELFALAMSDKDYVIEEKQIIEDIAVKFSISEQDQENLKQCVLDLLDVYNRLRLLTTE